jgi:hypothetical protein
MACSLINAAANKRRASNLCDELADGMLSSFRGRPACLTLPGSCSAIRKSIRGASVGCTRERKEVCRKVPKRSLSSSGQIGYDPLAGTGH